MSSVHSAIRPPYHNCMNFALASTPDDKPSETINSLRVLSGGLAAASAKTILAPLNRLTIILQSQGMSSLNHNYTTVPAYTGIVSSLKTMLTNEGALSLWNGNGVNVLRVIPNYGLRFGLNDISREWVCRFNGLDPRTTRHSMTKTQLFLSSSLAAVVQILCTYPIEVMSTRLTLSGSALSPIKYHGLWDCLNTTVKQEGIMSLYNGCKITLLAGTPYITLQMSLFELFQRQLHDFFMETKQPNALAPLSSPPSSQSQEQPIGVVPKLLAGASASLLAQTLTYPGDILRRRMQADGMGTNRKYAYNGIFHATKMIYQQEGWKAFFKGIHVNSLRILPEGALLFLLVDFFKKVVDVEKYDAH